MISIHNWLHPKVKILQQQVGGLLALEKPIDVLSHPNDNEISPKALIQAPYDGKTQAYRLKNERIYLLHRLDAPTSGVILLAQSLKLAEFIYQAFENQAVNKTYYAVVHGCPVPKPAIWKDKLKTHHAGDQLRTVKGEGALAQTEQSIIKKNLQYPIALLKLKPLTGLTHQLRVQCALHHTPIVGDKTYGHFIKNKNFAQKTGEKRLFLHAAHIELKLPCGALYTASSPLPGSFLSFFK